MLGKDLDKQSINRLVRRMDQDGGGGLYSYGLYSYGLMAGPNRYR